LVLLAMSRVAGPGSCPRAYPSPPRAATRRQAAARPPNSCCRVIGGVDGASVIWSRFPELASNRPLTDRPEPARRERQVGAGARSGQAPGNRGRLPRRPARRPPDGLFLLLPAGTAAAFVGVQLAVFGVLLGGAFAPNHIGMPIVPAGLKVDFLRRQVLMSRNISGGRITCSAGRA